MLDYLREKSAGYINEKLAPAFRSLHNWRVPLREVKVRFSVSYTLGAPEAQLGLVALGPASRQCCCSIEQLVSDACFFDGDYLVQLTLDISCNGHVGRDKSKRGPTVPSELSMPVSTALLNASIKSSLGRGMA